MSRIVIFANGVLNRPDRLRQHLGADDRIFCADGGTEHALALGLRPEAVVGDLDSLSPALASRLEQQGVALHRHPRDKDQTDLELTLEMAVAQQPAEIVLVSALGGRLDQMLANILLLTQPAYASVRLSLVDGLQWASLLRSHQSVTVRGQAGDTLSLIPLTPTVTGVSLSGVKWPLDQATLTLGSTWGISNQLTQPQAKVRIGQGLLLLVQLDKNYEED